MTATQQKRAIVVRTNNDGIFYRYPHSYARTATGEPYSDGIIPFKDYPYPISVVPGEEIWIPTAREILSSMKPVPPPNLEIREGSPTPKPITGRISMASDNCHADTLLTRRIEFSLRPSRNDPPRYDTLFQFIQDEAENLFRIVGKYPRSLFCGLHAVNVIEDHPRFKPQPGSVSFADSVYSPRGGLKQYAVYAVSPETHDLNTLTLWTDDGKTEIKLTDIH
jgi:hypothetical protein